MLMANHFQDGFLFEGQFHPDDPASPCALCFGFISHDAVVSARFMCCRRPAHLQCIRTWPDEALLCPVCWVDAHHPPEKDIPLAAAFLRQAEAFFRAGNWFSVFEVNFLPKAPPDVDGRLEFIRTHIAAIGETLCGPNDGMTGLLAAVKDPVDVAEAFYRCLCTGAFRPSDPQLWKDRLLHADVRKCRAGSLVNLAVAVTRGDVRGGDLRGLSADYYLRVGAYYPQFVQMHMAPNCPKKALSLLGFPKKV